MGKPRDKPDLPLVMVKVTKAVPTPSAWERLWAQVLAPTNEVPPADTGGGDGGKDTTERQVSRE